MRSYCGVQRPTAASYCGRALQQGPEATGRGTANQILASGILCAFDASSVRLRRMVVVAQRFTLPCALIGLNA